MTNLKQEKFFERFLSLFFKRCPKSGRIVGLNLKNKFVRYCFPITGILALAWFLVRVIPKPSRAGYPCMQVVTPIASGFVAWAVGLGVSVFAFKKARQNFKNARYGLGAVCVLLAVVAVVGTVSYNAVKSVAAGKLGFNTNNTLIANSPMGTGVGVKPGRVVWARNPDATNENWTNSPGNGYFLEQNNNLSLISAMFDNAVKSLADKPTVSEAWNAIFTNYNGSHGKGLVPYSNTETIFIKVNGVSCGAANFVSGTYEIVNNGTYNNSETSPAVVLALLKELIDDCHVPQERIVIGEPAKDIYKHSVDMWRSRYPNVQVLGVRDLFPASVMEKRTLSVRTSAPMIHYSDKGTILREGINGDGTQGTPVYNDLSWTIFETAAYVINVPALKAHNRGGISGLAKNHFGSQSRFFTPPNNFATHQHSGLVNPNGEDVVPDARKGYNKYRILVDLLAHKNIGGKTVLNVVDGLWGGNEAISKPEKFVSAPFNNDFPNSILVSQDQVALESVCFDILREVFRKERNASQTSPQMDGVDDYIHQAADPSLRPAGIAYDPENDGFPLITSLGVHEHWNNAELRQYSRNLFPNNNAGIELVNVDGLVPTSNFAIYCGSTTPYTAVDGTIYDADRNSTGGTAASNTFAIAGTTDPKLYQSERWGSCSYAFNGMVSGSYNITFKFAETYVTAANQRLFDVKVEGNTAISQLDIFAQAGGLNRAYDRTVTASVTDGTLNIEFIQNPAANNPKICAFVVKPANTVNYTLTTSATNGTVSPASGTYVSGSEVPLTPTPNSGYVFSSWGGDLSGSLNPGSITMNGNKNVTAIFVLAPTLVKQTVSGVVSNSDEGSLTLAGNAIDGSTTTRWASAFSDPQWIRFDMGPTPKSITTVVFDWEAANAKDYTLEASNDITFAPANRVVLATKTNMAAGNHRIDSLYTFTGSYRYYRMYGTARNLTYGYSIYEARFYTSGNPVTYTLTTAASPTAFGTVTGNTGTYTAGSPATITANANPGYAFASWSGSASGSLNPLTITMDASKSVTANFVPTYTVTTTVLPAASGTITGNSGTYQSNATAMLTAVPASGYSFTSWIINGVTSTTNPASIVMNGNKTVTANFAVVPTYTITATVSPAASGTITGNSGTYTANTTANLTAVAVSGYSFTSWTINGVTSTTNPASIVMDGNKTVTANFAVVPTYTITATVAPAASGTITGNSGTYTANTTANLTAVAASGYVFTSWTISGVTSTANPVSIVMNSNKTVTANFTLVPTYTISTSIAPVGSGTISGNNGPYLANTSASLTALPASGYVFTSWTISGVTSTVNPVSITMNSNKIVSANFTPSNVISLPGRFEAENYKSGGQNVGYYDKTTGNLGNYTGRNDDVDMETTGDVAGGSYNVGWTDAGEWLAYDVNVTQAGTYKLAARVASLTAGTKTLTVTIDGGSPLTVINATTVLGWQTYADEVSANFSLTAGPHVIRIESTTGGLNLNYYVVSVSTTTNLITNGDFAFGSTGWTTAGTAYGTGNFTSQTADWTITSASGQVYEPQMMQAVSLVAGRQYTICFDVRTDESARSIVVSVNGDADNSWADRGLSQTVNVTTSWSRPSFTFTANATDATARLDFNMGANANDVIIDNVKLVEGTTCN